jgi:diacylglycerol kinase (ATP)
VVWQVWLSAGAVLLVAVALWLRRRARTARTIAPIVHRPNPTTRRARIAFVVNPTKPGADDLRDRALRVCAERGLPIPGWYVTTPTDPGTGQARYAMENGADVVIAAGGDGTVRAVAQVLAGTDTSMALVPLGTGNLLARNLDLPLTDAEALLRIALDGRDRKIDVGRLAIVRTDHTETDGDGTDGAVPGESAHTDESGPGHAGSHGTGPDHTGPEAAGPGEDGTTEHDAPRPMHMFLVIAGLGFDAAMVATTDEALKARVGWIAYFLAGLRHLHARRMRLEVRLDEGPWYQLRLRCLMVGNCGRLPGGITLLPDAEVDDGWLDVGAIDTRGGLFGWTQLFGEVAMQRFGVRTELPNKIGRIDHARARRVRIRTREPQPLQVDGDVIGSATEVEATVELGALTVRVA